MQPRKSKLRSRKLWLALITDLAALAAALVPIEYQDLVLEASVRLGGLLTAALVTAGYLWSEGKIDERSVDAEGRLAELRERSMQMREQRADEAEQRKAERKASAHAWPVLLAMLAMLAMFGGCAIFNPDPDLGPEDRWHSARDALTTAQNVAVQQWRTGNLSDEQLVAVDRHREKVALALEVARDRLDGDQPAGDTLALIEDALDAIIAAAQAGDFEEGQLEAVTDPLPTEATDESSEADSTTRGRALGGGVCSLDRPRSGPGAGERGNRRERPRGHYESGRPFGFTVPTGGGRSSQRAWA